MPESFSHDVFLSHSAKDKKIVRDLAERLKKDGIKVWFDEWEIKPGDSIPSKIEEGLECSRVLVLCMSANAFGSDWAQLESGTFRFRDPLNKERRFLPLRLDDAPIKGSLAQFLYINWLPESQEREYIKLVDSCHFDPTKEEDGDESTPSSSDDGRVIFAHHDGIYAVGVSTDGRWAIADTVRSRLIKVPLDTRISLPRAPSSERRAESSPLIRNLVVSPDGVHVLTCSSSPVIEVWDFKEIRKIRELTGQNRPTCSVHMSADGRMVVGGSYDGTIAIWDFATGELLDCIYPNQGAIKALAISRDRRSVFFGTESAGLGSIDLRSSSVHMVQERHSGGVTSIAMSPNGRNVITGSEDRTIRIWDTHQGECVAVLEGHTSRVFSLAVTRDGKNIVSGGYDKTVRVWDTNSGECLRVFRGHAKSVRSVKVTPDNCRIVSGSVDGTVRVWPLARKRTEGQGTFAHYTNAKVLIVGETNSGKTGLTHRLATGAWKPSEDSTVGAWSTQLKLKGASSDPGVDREIWLWDFGGQADQRLIHQLYMDRTALILLLFNADQEDVLPGLRDWQTALRRCVKEKIPHFLVAGRIDAGFKASRGKLQAFAKEQGLAYHETSAKEGDGCDELRAAMIAGIPWAQMEKRTSPRIFKLIKDEILKLRDEGQVLHTFKELRELLWRRVPNEPRFSDETLQTVIGLLDGPGVVKELEYGTYILLAPEWINAYAQAVIRTLRSAENDLGVLPLRSIAEGKLIYQSIGRDGAPVEMKRLPSAEERVVLGEMERQLEQRGLCLRQGDKLVFPSHCGRDRPAVLEHPSVFVSYAVKGYLDDIYATLVVKLADSEACKLKELWRDAADFVSLADDHHMGIKLTRETANHGDISVYFGKGVTREEQVIFANYIHSHLKRRCEAVTRLRQYVCPHCHTPKGNSQVLMQKLVSQGHAADTECDMCGERFPLWDSLEEKFADKRLTMRSDCLNLFQMKRLDSRRKGKLLALEVAARINSADQKCFEIPGTEDEGIDMEIEFTDDEGKGTGKRLYLQLKCGNSHLRTRKTDGAEMFTIKEQRWVKYWLAQNVPVMLVIGTFDGLMEYAENKIEFADVRWMEIGSVLKRESNNGKRQVKQIEFKGERMDLASVKRWRDRVLAK